MRFDKPGHGVNTTNRDQDRRPLTPFEQALQDQITNALNSAGRSSRAPAVGINPNRFQDGTAPNHYLGGVDREGIDPGFLGEQAFQRFPEMDVAYRTESGGGPQMNQIEAYIRQAAQKRGYDPEAVMRIVMNEGGVKDAALRSRGYDPSLGGQEQSYGPFQMNMHAGLGKRLLQEKGIDVRDPNNVYAGIDYALNAAGIEGWTPWLNTQNKLGYDKWTGLKQGAEALPVANPLSPGAQDFVLNNPQPGGFGPGVPDPNSPLFGSMSPGGGSGGAGGAMAQDSGIPMFVANHLGSLDDGSQEQNPLQQAGAAFSKAADAYPAPRINGAFSGDARQSGDLLMKALQNPQALAQLLMKQRLG